MWKNVNTAVATQPEIASQPAPTTLPSASKSLNDTQVGLREAVGENEDRLSTTAMMATYAEAVHEFTKNATVCIGFLPLISKARDGYEQATRASTQLRKMLDASQIASSELSLEKIQNALPACTCGLFSCVDWECPSSSEGSICHSATNPPFFVE
jgi:hypothetical protein